MKYRLAILLALVIPLVAAIALLRPREAGLPQIRISILPIINTVPVRWGIENGWFKMAGIDVEIATNAPGRIAMAAVIGGDIDLAFTTIDAPISMRSQGFDIVLVAGNARANASPPDGSALVLAPASDVHRWKDLVGRTVLVNALYNTNWVYTREAVERDGGDPDKVGFIEVPFSNMVNALLNGAADAASMAEPATSIALTGDKAMRVLGYQYLQVQPSLTVTAWAGDRSWIDKNQSSVQKFVQVLDSIFAHFNDEPAVRSQAIKAFLDLDQNQTQAVVFDHFTTQLDASDIAKQISLITKHLELREQVSVSDLIYAFE
jgi:NitT/TauT family transport system substrate-binding protein